MFNPWGLLLIVLGGVLLWEAWLGDPGHLWGVLSGHQAGSQVVGGNVPPAALGPQINIPGLMPPPGTIGPTTPVQTD